LPSVVQTVEQALKCYQALSGQTDAMQPKGLPKLNSVEMDFKVTTGKTVGLTFSIFVFKIGGSHEKDVTDDLKFTYSVPKKIALPQTLTLATVQPADLFQELVNDIRAAGLAAQAQSTAMGLPLSQVSIAISYGIKFDANASLNVPVQLVTIGGNGDYNKNTTQTITLKFGE
ncbi:MAG: trypco2 family protein, partial [Candidatus Acidiferrales bacterium]